MYYKRAYLKPWSFLYLENTCVGSANLLFLVHVAMLIPFFLLIYFANPKKKNSEWISCTAYFKSRWNSDIL